MPKRVLPLASLINGSVKAARIGQIYVSRLHWSISPGVLYSYFERFGKVESVYIPYDLRTGLSKGYGFVCMKDKESVKTALEHKNQFIGQFNVLIGPRKSKSVKETVPASFSKLADTQTKEVDGTATEDSLAEELVDSSEEFESCVDPPKTNLSQTTLESTEPQLKS